MKTVLPIGDLHCGHKVGLTPPEWQHRPDWKDQQNRLWTYFKNDLKQVRASSPTGEIDILIVNGDAIDGNGYRSGGIEQSEIDWDRQCEMAIDVINYIGAKQVYMTYGTPSHVSNNGSQEEYKIAKAVGASITGHLFLDIEGVMFDVKHKIGSSSVPHGRASALMKAILWNQRQAQEGAQPRADVLLRSHVHYHVYAGDHDTLGVTLPCLQGPGSKYGIEQCEGIVDFGLAWFNVEDGAYDWSASTHRLRSEYMVCSA